MESATNEIEGSSINAEMYESPCIDFISCSRTFLFQGLSMEHLETLMSGPKYQDTISGLGATLRGA